MDTWMWIARLKGGSEVCEDQVGRLAAVPASLIESLALRKRGSTTEVVVNMDTGIAVMPSGAVINPAFEDVPQRRVPLFFRRKSKKPGDAKINVDFRALGFVVFDQDRPVRIEALRIYEREMDSRYQLNWPESTASHIAGTGVIAQ